MTTEARQAPASMLEMMEQLGVNDPRLMALGQMLKASGATESAPGMGQAETSTADLERLAKRNRRLEEENTFMRERLDILAAGLGACARCWGEDGSCRMCAGEGRPGHFRPDRDHFQAYVLPAVRAMHDLMTRHTSTARSSRQRDDSRDA